MEQNIEQSLQEQEERLENINELIEKYGILTKKYGISFWEDAANFADNIRTAYPEFGKYRLFHILGFSGGAHVDSAPEYDFPGEFSVEKFINEKYQKYLDEIN